MSDMDRIKALAAQMTKFAVYRYFGGPGMIKLLDRLNAKVDEFLEVSCRRVASKRPA